MCLFANLITIAKAVVKSTVTIICRVPFSEQTCNLNLHEKGLCRIPTDLLIG